MLHFFKAIAVVGNQKVKCKDINMCPKLSVKTSEHSQTETVGYTLPWQHSNMIFTLADSTRSTTICQVLILPCSSTVSLGKGQHNFFFSILQRSRFSVTNFWFCYLVFCERSYSLIHHITEIFLPEKEK